MESLVVVLSFDLGIDRELLAMISFHLVLPSFLHLDG